MYNVFLSASAIKDYLECPRKVYYRLFRDEKYQTPEMMVGTIVHEAIEKFWDNDQDAIKYCTEKASTLPPRERQHALHCLNNFQVGYKLLLSSEDSIEMKFKIPYGDIFFVGKMDRVLPSGTLIDWKTSRHTEHFLSRSPQFILYSFAYERIFGKKPQAVINANLSEAQNTLYEKDPAVEAVFFNQLVPEIVSSIKNEKFTPTGIFNKKCSRCIYFDSCREDIGAK